MAHKGSGLQLHGISTILESEFGSPVAMSSAAPSFWIREILLITQNGCDENNGGKTNIVIQLVASGS